MKHPHPIAAPRHPWPFMSNDTRIVTTPMCRFCGQYPAETTHPCPSFAISTTAPVADLDDEPDDEDESPYCRCDLLPTQEEADRNRCAACGKVLK